MPNLLYVASIFFLFFLGGYYFYVNIFHKEIVIAAFGDKFDDYSWIAHLLDVLLLLIHYWQLGVISKCRRYYKYVLLEDKHEKSAHKVRISADVNNFTFNKICYRNKHLALSVDIAALLSKVLGRMKYAPVKHIQILRDLVY
ncbi:unnamed protein product [Haemonchus placei]|uniref:Uncharacterized protein n=1 Tax=Haemonchus placei TaxID=6290 RepID=A0A3P7X7R7_HAEPC|nr:unnamed protein product [Haemonchus placei]